MTQHLEWHCNYCHEGFPHFKALVEHYKEKHAKNLRRFEVISKIGNGRGIVPATSAEEACRFFGWRVEDCKIEELPL